jgi:(p)ppGpp synthase/HD superfamily hydrolase
MLHGYSDRIHHALAFTVKHYPEPVSRYDGQSCLIRASSVAVILARYGADECSIVASILKQLVDACPPERHEKLLGDIGTKFGAPVAGTVAVVAEPRFDVLGRERTWKACRLEYLTRLSSATPRAVDVVVADELHRIGAALVSVRRLGVEYLQSAGVPHPEETRWWCAALGDALRSHATWRRPAMLNDFERLTDELGLRLGEVGL